MTIDSDATCCANASRVNEEQRLQIKALERGMATYRADNADLRGQVAAIQRFAVGNVIDWKALAALIDEVERLRPLVDAAMAWFLAEDRFSGDDRNLEDVIRSIRKQAALAEVKP